MLLSSLLMMILLDVTIAVNRNAIESRARIQLQSSVAEVLRLIQDELRRAGYQSKLGGTEADTGAWGIENDKISFHYREGEHYRVSIVLFSEKERKLKYCSERLPYLGANNSCGRYYSMLDSQQIDVLVFKLEEVQQFRLRDTKSKATKEVVSSLLSITLTAKYRDSSETVTLTGYVSSR